MPLCTIFTKWPAPFGPQCRYPCSAGDGSPVRPGVRSTVPTPGASAGEDRVEPSDDVVLAADHEAVAALEPPDAAAGADVDVVEARRP